MNPQTGIRLSVTIGFLGGVLAVVNVLLGDYLQAIPNLLLVAIAYLSVLSWRNVKKINRHLETMNRHL